MNSCYDAPTLQNQFCGLFQRAGAGGGPNGEIPFQIIEGSLQQTLLNYAQLKVRGLDVDVAYRHRVGFGEIGTHFIWSHYFQNDQFIDPTQPGFADRLLGEITYPRNAFNWDVTLRSGIFDLFYQMRYLSPMATDFIEDIESVQGRPPQNADFSEPRRTPGVFYHNVRLGITPNDRYTFYLGVDNVLDQKPPLGATGNLALVGSANTSASTGIYENKGRYLYAGFNAKF
jgi:outer membrane receptor protein involved in Fe transport